MPSSTSLRPRTSKMADRLGYDPRRATVAVLHGATPFHISLMLARPRRLGPWTLCAEEEEEEEEH
ncbi:hypothetical protein O9K51_02309 [Purpureocillium lavendulum]|uniref:Uncharacterized protein n=1 Tax=Purpureocillium lavendulum TaxID=1247861 RepID=A0AB34FXT1_9HYPO|nr:hypothetical protein O9K51_02309 [Purpureocillium lavendulum]